MGVAATSGCVHCDGLTQQLPELLSGVHADLVGLEVVLRGCVLKDVRHGSSMIIQEVLHQGQDFVNQ